MGWLEKSSKSHRAVAAGGYWDPSSALSLLDATGIFVGNVLRLT